MVFWTIFFLTVSLIALFKRGLHADRLYKAVDIVHRKEKGLHISKEEGNYIISTVALLVLICFPLFVINVIYISQALYIDPFLIPTLLSLGLVIIGVIKASITDGADIKTEIGLAKVQLKLEKQKNGILFNIQRLGWVAYYSYILWVLLV